MQEIRVLHDDVFGQQPWKRILWSGSFLPEVTDEQPKNPRHQKSVKLFHDALKHFWDVAGQTIWMRLFQIEHNTKARDDLAYHVVRLVFELHQLIKNSDYDESLIRFLCIPHPAWPQFSDPVDLNFIREAHGSDAAKAYLTEQAGRFWPVVPSKAARAKSGQAKDFSCPLGSAFAVVADRGPRSNNSSRTTYWKQMREYNCDPVSKKSDLPEEPPSKEDVQEMLRETCSVAAAFIRSGATFPDDEELPFVSVELPSDADRPEQWFHGIPAPRTKYRWAGEKSTKFWRSTPQIEELSLSGSGKRKPDVKQTKADRSRDSD
ncbi:hypothetical protein AC1031_008536 [Aphanomyces cochlioides]|nr:hypothetical protein AC1031_008536 [Aphanomyces cochlioides]